MRKLINLMYLKENKNIKGKYNIRASVYIYRFLLFEFFSAALINLFKLKMNYLFQLKPYKIHKSNEMLMNIHYFDFKIHKIACSSIH